MVEIRLHGFSRAELFDLEAKLGAGNVKEAEAPAAGSTFNNLELCDVIVSLGPSLIAVLGVWLAKNRSHERRDENVSVAHSDGTVTHGRVTYQVQSESSEAEVVRQLATIANVSDATKASRRKKITKEKAKSTARKMVKKKAKSTAGPRRKKR
jgi:hypothetical protein